MDTGRMIMQNTKHRHSTPITTDQYLDEQIRKAAGQLEDIFLQAVPLEHSRVLKPHMVGTKTHMTHRKEIMNREEEKWIVVP